MGGGPAGLAAALTAARLGARVTLVEAAPRVGGLCVTRTQGPIRYDLGGHIPFVRDRAREEWLRGLLGDDLVWVPRPVASLRDGRLRRGRYLDQRPDAPHGPAPTPGAATSAAEVLSAMFGPGFVDLEMRPYLEKVDGLPLERIPGARPLRLMRDQAAPEGFWFPALGIGQLMDAMRDAAAAAGADIRTATRVTAIEAAGGRLRHLETHGPDGVARLAADRLVVAVPPGPAAGLLNPAPPATGGPVTMRAVCLVFLAVDGPPLTGEAWVQVDDPRVPFSRVMEVGNWSARMSPEGTAVLGMECYCRPSPDDPVWGLDDAALAARCAQALASPLGWLDDPARVRVLEVLRLPRAYPEPDLAQVPRVAAAAEALRGVRGVHLAPGAEVLTAVEAGEAAAAAALSPG